MTLRTRKAHQRSGSDPSEGVRESFPNEIVSFEIRFHGNMVHIVRIIGSIGLRRFPDTREREREAIHAVRLMLASLGKCGSGSRVGFVIIAQEKAVLVMEFNWVREENKVESCFELVIALYL